MEYSFADVKMNILVCVYQVSHPTGLERTCYHQQLPSLSKITPYFRETEKSQPINLPDSKISGTCAFCSLILKAE